MGYTNYWYQKKSFSETEWKKKLSEEEFKILRKKGTEIP